jgi:hypothetical protein
MKSSQKPVEHHACPWFGTTASITGIDFLIQSTCHSNIIDIQQLWHRIPLNILILHYYKPLSGLSGKFPNYTSKSFSHLHGATGLCPIRSTPLHLLHIAPSISSSFGTIPGMLLLEYCIALPEFFFNLLNRLKSSSFQYSFHPGKKERNP